jgi:hypothetical protein
MINHFNFLYYIVVMIVQLRWIARVSKELVDADLFI